MLMSIKIMFKYLFLNGFLCSNVSKHLINLVHPTGLVRSKLLRKNNVMPMSLQDVMVKFCRGKKDLFGNWSRLNWPPQLLGQH